MNSTSQEIIHGWVSVHSGRGSIEILWTCLATTVICTWSVLHLPPPQFTRPTFHDKFLKFLEMILVPDLVAHHAAVDLINAYDIKCRLRGLGFDSCTLTHGFFLKKGGFRVQDPRDRRLGSDEDRLVYYVPNTRPRWISALKLVTDADIHALSNSDGLLKLIACVQAYMACISCHQQMGAEPFRHLTGADNHYPRSIHPCELYPLLGATSKLRNDDHSEVRYALRYRADR